MRPAPRLIFSVSGGSPSNPTFQTSENTNDIRIYPVTRNWLPSKVSRTVPPSVAMT
jgi:hypothetical protein